MQQGGCHDSESRSQADLSDPDMVANRDKQVACAAAGRLRTLGSLDWLSTLGSLD